MEPSRSLVLDELKSCRSALIAVAVFSGFINILMLTGSLFMLQVYDRVLPSRSVPTLVGLLALVAGLYLALGMLDTIRARIMIRVGRSLDEGLSGDVYLSIVQRPLRARGHADGLQPLRDLDQLRGFLSSAGPTAIFDLPWMPLYLALCFAFHFWIGLTASVGVLILVTLALLSEILVRAPTKSAARHVMARLTLAEASRRNAEALTAMGMARHLGARWAEANARYMSSQQNASDLSVTLGAVSRMLRMLLQSTVLAVGAYLVIKQQATAGVIIASSILTSRSMAPVESAIAHWKGFLAARQSWQRLSDLLEGPSPTQPQTGLPTPCKGLSVEAISVTPPGHPALVVRGATFQLAAGQALGVIGPSASGKSSLARALVGVWQPSRGTVRLDGAALDQWPSEALGRQIGFLPQDVELFEGTVAENIARFDTERDPAAVIAAAQATGVHDMILSLPEGYDTRIGEAGQRLSAGQRQRVALARALYRDPFLVVLDEPNSNLDSDGEDALTAAIMGVRKRGGIVVVIAHRPSALAAVDCVAAMARSEIQAFGPKNEVLRRVLRYPPVPNRLNARPERKLGSQ
jgi:ATP-binding cassette subfamily C protein